ncbi:hypothetical protein D8674_003798 [Pyrus ussuriensis x Pyrus communis]|uniref:Bifunctional inhibitor/plant lipid transfer protein/seed storage helical domain-containing protein n=1 Tax=Pyrus ussuriensis x Pyrus communis TaxID=2448454 RepID=A0A5N5FIR1_9ROSA|nr:hypothetical protein D8674_003798 [Pyrus ussuriensis x Pyrus communis]
MAKADTSPSQCKQEVGHVHDECRSVILPGRNPSALCCQLVRAAHVKCVCSYVTPKVANFIPVRRTIRQIEGCGRSVPRNFKCGSEFSTSNLYLIYIS